jgi:hypothetical protein
VSEPSHDGLRATAPPPVPPHAATVPLEGDLLETDLIAPRDHRKRWTVLLVVGGIAVVVALVVGARASRHAPPEQARAPEPVVAPAPLPVAPPALTAPTAPTAPQVEIALDPGGTAPRPVAEGEAAPAAEDATRAQLHRRGHPGTTRLAKHALKPWPAPDRDATPAAYLRGNSLLSAGDAGGAVAAYQEAVRLAPSDPAGYRGLGLAYEKLGKTNEAVTALLSCLKLSHRARDRELVARRLYRLTHPQDN